MTLGLRRLEKLPQLIKSACHVKSRVVARHLTSVIAFRIDRGTTQFNIVI